MFDDTRNKNMFLFFFSICKPTEKMNQNKEEILNPAELQRITPPLLEALTVDALVVGMMVGCLNR